MQITTWVVLAVLAWSLLPLLSNLLGLLRSDDKPQPEANPTPPPAPPPLPPPVAATGRSDPDDPEAAALAKLCWLRCYFQKQRGAAPEVWEQQLASLSAAILAAEVTDATPKP